MEVPCHGTVVVVAVVVNAMEWLQRMINDLSLFFGLEEMKTAKVSAALQLLLFLIKMTMKMK